MKFISVTEYATGEKVIVNIEKIDFMVRQDESTSIRINGDEFSACETPEQIVGQLNVCVGGPLND